MISFIGIKSKACIILMHAAAMCAYLNRTSCNGYPASELCAINLYLQQISHYNYTQIESSTSCQPVKSCVIIAMICVVWVVTSIDT